MEIAIFLGIAVAWYLIYLVVNFNKNYLKGVADFHGISYEEAKSLAIKDRASFEQEYVMPYRMAVRSGAVDSDPKTGESSIASDAKRESVPKYVKIDLQSMQDALERKDFDYFRMNFPDVEMSQQQFDWWSKGIGYSSIVFHTACFIIYPTAKQLTNEQDKIELIMDQTKITVRDIMAEQDIAPDDIKLAVGLCFTTFSRFAGVNSEKVTEAMKKSS